MSEFEKLWCRLDECRYTAYAIQDPEAKKLIQELCDIVMDLVDTLDVKEKKR